MKLVVLALFAFAVASGTLATTTAHAGMGTIICRGGGAIKTSSTLTVTVGAASGAEIYGQGTL